MISWGSLGVKEGPWLPGVLVDLGCLGLVRFTALQPETIILQEIQRRAGSRARRYRRLPYRHYTCPVMPFWIDVPPNARCRAEIPAGSDFSGFHVFEDGAASVWFLGIGRKEVAHRTFLVTRNDTEVAPQPGETLHHLAAQPGPDGFFYHLWEILTPDT